jgi:hypothetical protein
MNSTDDPATESQLIHLRQLGFIPNHELSRVEAARIIGTLHRHPGNTVDAANHSSPIHLPGSDTDAHYFGTAVSEARQAAMEAGPAPGPDVQSALNQAMRNRQDFWMDTCRDPTQRQTAAGHHHSSQVWDLYMKYGCRFNAPNHEQTQEVLDALDTALPKWDQTHAELFYQTLELNFPHLVLQRINNGLSH